MRPHGPAPVGDEAQFRVLAEMIPQLVWRSLNDGRWDWAGPQWVAFTGQAEGESHGLGWQDVVHPDDRERTARHWHAALGQSGFDVEHRLRRVDGAYRWFQTRAVPLRDRGGGITHWFGTSTDVDDLRQAEQRALFLAHHDSLTGAASRIGLEHALARMALAEAPHCLLCLDLDGFKSFNDQHGHAGGDALLRQVADRLRGCLTHADLLARVGGDEFVVVRCEAQGYGPLARAIAAALATPLMVAGQTASVRTSIGIACSPHDGTVAEDLLRRADLALYRAKASGGGCALRFTRDMEDEVRERRALERDLAEALERGQIGVQFQPLFDLGGGGLRGFEALARWTHPERGVVAPARFIAAAERTGLVMPLGAAVLDLACSAAASWGEGVRVAVNLSPVQVYRADVPRLVADALARSGLAAQRLELEVTEGLLLEDGPLVQATLSALRGMGVRLVLDDFGTGYSSLSYLCRFRFDAVKVDRSFVAAMEGDAASQAVVTAVAALGRSLGMQVTAEGVETERQLALVRAAGCDLVQGFLLGRPVNREAATIMVRKASGPSDPPD